VNFKINIMAIAKQYLKTKPVCKVTFTVPAEEAKKVAVVGDFNNWSPKASALKKLKNGTFKGTFDLPKENSFEFKYLVDGEYVNEAEADRYQWNEYAGSDNAVIEL
jgi:1,4-alpha-glucan branching enzyme